MRLLLAERNTMLVRKLSSILDANRYTVETVENGMDAITYAQSTEYDGIILGNVHKPDAAGILKELRENKCFTPIIVLSEKADEQEEINMLNSGADDYMAKPYSYHVLAARVCAMLRRCDSFTPDAIKAGELTLLRSACRLSYEDRSVIITGKEFQLIEILIQRVGFAVPVEELISHVWGWEESGKVETSVIWAHMSNIRKTLRSIGAPVKIRCLHNGGYMLDAGVRAMSLN